MNQDELATVADESAADLPQDAGFTVGELIATAIDSFLSAAALHLGEPLPSGRSIAEQDPVEAYLALMAASGLLDQLGPVMNDDVKLPFQASVSNLAKRFATLHPRVMVPKLAPPPITSLETLVKAAWEALETAPAASPPRTATGPSQVRPGLGLPQGKNLGSGFLGGTGPFPGR